MYPSIENEYPSILGNNSISFGLGLVYHHQYNLL